MKRAAVLGSPISHSLSPTLHQAGYAALGMDDWCYGRHETDEGGLAPFVEGLDETWRGLSLTMPLKAVAFDVADEVTELARRAGAINTLVRRDGGWVADNTDVHGIVAAVRDAGVDSPRVATVLGAGATARSALLALSELGVEEIRVAARDERKALALVRGLRDVLRSTDTSVGWWEIWPYDWPPNDLVISTVPAGPANESAASPITTRCRSEVGDAVVLDVVYADWPTPVARAAESIGATVVSGMEMLVHQAARQFELFTGHPAPLAAMQAAGRAALGSE